jgi:hypothetical protein
MRCLKPSFVYWFHLPIGLAFNAFLPSSARGCGAFQLLAFDAVWEKERFLEIFGLLTFRKHHSFPASVTDISEVEHKQSVLRDHDGEDYSPLWNYVF